MIRIETDIIQLQVRKSVLEGVIDEVATTSMMVHLYKKDLLYLYKESNIQRCKISLSNNNGVGRMEQIFHQLSDNPSVDLSQYNKVILLFKTSRLHPIKMSEMSNVKDIIGCFPNEVSVIWGLGIDDSLDKSLSLLMICSK
ncbi:MAG: hypothetical protein IJ064_02620 [Bacteroidaceae bacterium]|nr:hypothetical protein [Bacteroidaceae bacterium]